jgi:hypothetical protein
MLHCDGFAKPNELVKCAMIGRVDAKALRRTFKGDAVA